MYLIKSPWWLRALYPALTWRMPAGGKKIYLTFDDGPHEQATPFVLDQLKQFNAKASFFCIGKNVAAHPGIYQRIIDEGHAVGNHTWDHLNGWKTGDSLYMDDIRKTTQVIRSGLFRPPYGRIRYSQIRQLRQDATLPSQIIMWDILSGDFDTSLEPEKCLKHVLQYSSDGSIVLFHDSEKAFPRMSYALPRFLAAFSSKGYSFQSLPDLKGRCAR